MRCLSLPVAGLALLALSSALHGQPARPDALVVAEDGDRFVLSVPVSRLTLSLPKEGFKQSTSMSGGATTSARYFLFENRAGNTFVSGWFESASEFRGLEKFWEQEMAAWPKTGLQKPEEVSFKKLGGWQAVVYFVPVPSGSYPNIRAHWLQAGTWIDVHLSCLSGLPREEAYARLLAVLETFRVTQR